MNPFDQAIADLEQKFNVVGVVNLYDSQLYQRLQNLYQTEYNHNDRIIIIQDTADTYDYIDLPGAAILRLQKYLDQIDISKFFIVVVTGNADIKNELLQISNEISFIQVEPYFNNVVIRYEDTFCPLPWMHLYVGTDGNVLPCCVADHQYPMGNIEEATPLEIGNNKKFIQIRQNMLSGQRSKECSYCYQKEDSGLPSLRQEQIKRWKIDTDSAFNPIYLDIRLNNVCNLKCRMCSGYFSSSIAQEDAELFGTTISIENSLRNRQRKLALEEIVEFLPSAEKIYFAGGEPLLAPEHYIILQKLIDCGNTDLEIFYNTNFTRLQFRNINVLDLWKKFGQITIGASLDAIGPVAEYVRHSTVWTDIENNLDLLQNYCPNVNFTVTSAVGFMNAASLIELQKNWHNNRRLDISKFSLHAITSPEHMTLAVLPDHHKNRLEKLITDHIHWCCGRDAYILAEQWQDMLNYMLSTDLTHYLDEFRRLTRIMDQHRKQDFGQVLPEFKDLL